MAIVLHRHRARLGRAAMTDNAAAQVHSAGKCEAYFFMSLLPAEGEPSFDISFFGLFLDIPLDMPEVPPLFMEPLFMDPLFMDPLSMLFMPGLFISFWAAAGAPVLWANAELHMRVKAAAATSFFIGVLRWLSCVDNRPERTAFLTNPLNYKNNFET